jgi:DNA-binding response OmpR family regulator
MLKVLIIDDERVLLESLVQKISEIGYEVLQATNGKEGLEVALDKTPDLIILDIVMPEMDGLTMIKKLRESGDYGKKVKVLMLSNLDPNDKILPTMLKTEPAYYFIKANTSLEDLANKVKDIITK